MKIKIDVPPSVERTREVQEWVDEASKILTEHFNRPEIKERLMTAAYNTIIFGTPFPEGEDDEQRHETSKRIS